MRDLLDLARKLEDLTRNAGKHAGGVVIAPTPLTDFSPLFAEHVGKGETAQAASSPSSTRTTSRRSAWSSSTSSACAR